MQVQSNTIFGKNTSCKWRRYKTKKIYKTHTYNWSAATIFLMVLQSGLITIIRNTRAKLQNMP